MRRFFFATLLLIFLTTLTSCHGKGIKTDDNYKVPDTFDTSKKYNLSFWSKNDTNLEQKRVYDNAIVEFCKLYPNIEITTRSFTNYEDIYRNVITNISTDTTPNICISYPDHIATYISGKDTVVPLEALIDNPSYGLGGKDVLFESVKKEEVIEKFYNEGRINGKLYSLPFMRSSEACYINKTYVEKLGFTIPDVITYDFMFEVANKAMAEKGPDDILLPIIYKSTDNMMIQACKQAGYPISDDNGNINIVNDFSRSFLKQVSEEHLNGNFTTFGIVSYPGDYFNKGQCIFAIDSTAGSTWIGSRAPLKDIQESEVVEFETVVRRAPQLEDNGKINLISQGPSLCVFNKKDPGEVVASFLFLQFLLTNDIQLPYAQTEGYIPVTTKALNSDAYQDYLAKSGTDNKHYYSVKIDASKIVIDNIENTFVTSVFNGSMSLRKVSGELIEQACRKVDVTKKNLSDEGLQEIIDKQLRTLTVSRLSDEVAGPITTEMIILIIALAVSWVGIVSYFVVDFIKKKNIKVD